MKRLIKENGRWVVEAIFIKPNTMYMQILKAMMFLETKGFHEYRRTDIINRIIAFGDERMIAQDKRRKEYLTMTPDEKAKKYPDGAPSDIMANYMGGYVYGREFDTAMLKLIENGYVVKNDKKFKITKSGIELFNNTKSSE